MIRGIGTDIVNIGRIEEMIRKYGDHFLRKIFTESEIAYCNRHAVPAIHFAGRWATKEAFFKALPDSCQKLWNWKSAEVLPSRKGGRPVIEVVSPELRRQIEAERVTAFHLSISHEKETCVAVVVAEEGERIEERG